MIDELIRRTRSYRRFHQDEPIATAVLQQLVDLARLGGSARNIQPLKYLLLNDPVANAALFPHLAWAGYLPDWPGPEQGERPSAYIVCLLDSRLAREADCDLGIATQNMLLGATALGLGGCRIGSVNPAARRILGLADAYRILLVLALGRPRETVVLDEMRSGGDIRYWRDHDAVHHVPKRPLAELIISADPVASSRTPC